MHFCSLCNRSGPSGFLKGQGLTQQAQFGGVLVQAVDNLEQLLLEQFVAHALGGAHHGQGGVLVVGGDDIDGLAGGTGRAGQDSSPFTEEPES